MSWSIMQALWFHHSVKLKTDTKFNLEPITSGTIFLHVFYRICLLPGFSQGLLMSHRVDTHLLLNVRSTLMILKLKKVKMIGKGTVSPNSLIFNFLMVFIKDGAVKFVVYLCIREWLKQSYSEQWVVLWNLQCFVFLNVFHWRKMYPKALQLNYALLLVIML